MPAPSWLACCKCICCFVKTRFVCCRSKIARSSINSALAQFWCPRDMMISAGMRVQALLYAVSLVCMAAAIFSMLASVTRNPLDALGTRQLNIRLLVFGLDMAGKSILLGRLSPHQEVKTEAVTGLVWERASHKHVSIWSWDVGGAGFRMWPLWRQHLEEMRPCALIYVVDSLDRARMPEAQDELHKALHEEVLEALPLLVLANKQDLPHAMHAEEVARALSLPQLHGRRWHVQPCSALSMGGVYQGMRWLGQAILASRADEQRQAESL